MSTKPKAAMTKSLSERIGRTLEKYPGSTAREVAEIMHAEYRSVYDGLACMKKFGYVEQHGMKKSPDQTWTRTDVPIGRKTYERVEKKLPPDPELPKLVLDWMGYGAVCVPAAANPRRVLDTYGGGSGQTMIQERSFGVSQIYSGG